MIVVIFLSAKHLEVCEAQISAFHTYLTHFKWEARAMVIPTCQRRKTQDREVEARPAGLCWTFSHTVELAHIHCG